MKYKYLFFTICVHLLISCNNSDDTMCPDATCDDYVTQVAAQAVYDSNPECLGELDHDSDGIACEHLTTSGGGGSGCPTTSNCGCSGFNKDQCGGSCCRWIVGTGCKCK